MKKVSEGLGGRSKHSPMSVSSQMRSSACVSASTRFQVRAAGSSSSGNCRCPGAGAGNQAVGDVAVGKHIPLLYKEIGGISLRRWLVKYISPFLCAWHPGRIRNRRPRPRGQWCGSVSLCSPRQRGRRS